jgi:flagellar biosynthesis protein FlhB
VADQEGDKTFDATPHRRQQAREQGQVAYSQDLGSASLLLVGAMLLGWFGPGLVEFFGKLLQRQLGQVVTLVADDNLLLNQTRSLAVPIATTLGPILGLLLLAGILSTVMQIGFLFVPDKLAPDISRLSIWQGLQRLFSLQGVSRLGFGLVKVIIVAAIIGTLLWQYRTDVLESASLSTAQLAKLLIDTSLKTLYWVGLALFLLALFEFAFQKWKFEQDLKMTHQEVREEMKEMQGDPQIAARRRQVQRQLAMNRVGTAVPKADVVVTNPTELAIAIQYDPATMAAPVVLAKGAGVIAQRIRRLALENNVPVVERKPLAQLLYKQVKVNHPVPNETYAAVAEVLAYVYQLKGKKIPPVRAA